MSLLEQSVFCHARAHEVSSVFVKYWQIVWLSLVDPPYRRGDETAGQT